MTYLYGLIRGHDGPQVAATVRGLDDAAVRLLRCNDVTAIVSDGARRISGAKLDDVRAHDVVLQAYVDAGATVAATRFGQSFPDDADVVQHVNEFGQRVAKLLREYDGCVEMRVLLAMELPAAIPDEDTGRDVGPGRAYLDRIKHGMSSQRVAGLGVRAALGPVVRLERVEQLPRTGGVAFAHLVARADETAYRAAVAAVPALADARVVGPLALYSFAEPVS